MSFNQLMQEIRDLEHLRRLLLKIFLLSIIVPIPFGAAILYSLESPSNPKIANYQVALEYTLDTSLGTKLTNSTLSTLGGKVEASVLALLHLVFFGFVASIATTWVQLYLKNKQLDRLRGNP